MAKTEKKHPPMAGLRRLRKERGVTLDEMEELLFFHKRTIGGWEAGRGRPDEETIKRICEYFDCKKEDLW